MDTPTTTKEMPAHLVMDEHGNFPGPNTGNELRDQMNFLFAADEIEWKFKDRFGRSTYWLTAHQIRKRKLLPRACQYLGRYTK